MFGLSKKKKNYVRVPITLSDESKEEIQSLADSFGVSFSAAARFLLESTLENAETLSGLNMSLANDESNTHFRVS